MSNLSHSMRPAVPVNLKDVLKEPAAITAKGMPFWKMLLYCVMLFLLLNLLQNGFNAYQKKKLKNKIDMLRVGDNIVINNTIAGRIHKIEHQEIYVSISNGESIVPVKKEIIISVKVI